MASRRDTPNDDPPQDRVAPISGLLSKHAIVVLAVGLVALIFYVDKEDVKRKIRMKADIEDMTRLVDRAMERCADPYGGKALFAVSEWLDKKEPALAAAQHTYRVFFSDLATRAGAHDFHGRKNDDGQTSLSLVHYPDSNLAQDDELFEGRGFSSSATLSEMVGTEQRLFCNPARSWSWNTLTPPVSSRRFPRRRLRLSHGTP